MHFLLKEPAEQRDWQPINILQSLLIPLVRGAVGSCRLRGSSFFPAQRVEKHKAALQKCELMLSEWNIIHIKSFLLLSNFSTATGCAAATESRDLRGSTSLCKSKIRPKIAHCIACEPIPNCGRNCCFGEKSRL